MLAFEELGRLIALAIPVLWVLGQISSIFGKRDPQEAEKEKPSAAQKRPSPRRAKGAKPPTPPRHTTNHPTARHDTPTEAPAAASSERARPAPVSRPTPRARPAPISRSSDANAPIRPTAPNDQRPAAQAKPPRQTKVSKRVERRQPLRTRESISQPETARDHLGHAEAPPKRRRRLSESEKLLRVLRSRSGTRAAVQLSEILGPPVALRNDHLEL